MSIATPIPARQLLGYTIALIAINLVGLLAALGTGHVIVLVPVLTISLVAVVYFLVRAVEGRNSLIYWSTLLFSLLVTALVAAFYTEVTYNYRPIWVYSFATLSVVIGVVGFMEYGVLRLLAVFRLGALVRVTYYEALLQPFTLIVILLTLTAIIICTFVPYYTFDEDNKMYRDIATQFCILAGLAVMVFASAKVVDEEIENRTMLTLMSKPIARWQVVLGKYLGILCIVFTVLVVLGATTSTASYLHWLDDKRIDYNVSRGGEIADLTSQLYKALLALIPLFLLQFLQIATLAAIAVAISTRYPLALNVTVIAIVYITANLTAFIPGLGLAQPWRGLATYGSYLLPYLSNFDISQRLIYGYYTIGHQESIDYFRKGVPSLGEIWEYTALAGVYAVFYIGAALSVAMALFRTRELT